MLQLIIGKGAYRSGQLSQITAKHLSLSWNCIQFLQDELSYIQSHLSLAIRETADSKRMQKGFKEVDVDL